MRSVLLVHPDADAWVASRSFDAEITTTDSAASARAYLAGTAFDLVLVGPDVPGREAIGALRDVLGLSTVVESVAGPEALAARLEGPAVQPESAPPTASGLDEVAAELSRVAHALNNPLAVIAGNAQLSLEMAGVLDVDDSIVASLEAIAQAATELEALFADVAALRARVDRERGV